MKKIVKSDQVLVITGRDKGKTGQVVRVLPDNRLIVSGVCLVTKHTKGNPQQGKEGGLIRKEAPIQASNVAIINPNTGKPDRVGFRINEQGKKERFFKSDKSSVNS
ncbi:MAG: 50S ribosomal protein L24 [Gammaproteobacteria bacterium]